MKTPRVRMTPPTLLGAGVVLCITALTGCGKGADQNPGIASGPVRDDLYSLDESMLIDEGSVPPLTGTSWGAMVAVPRGQEPVVSPAGCEVFLSQGAAVQKGLAMRSSKNAAIGVSLTVPTERADLAALYERCRVFTFIAPGAESSVALEPWAVDGLPDGTISTLMHCRTVRGEQILEWDIAAIMGFHRGVLVTAQYTPGPQGGDFDTALASQLDGVYLAQIAKLG